MCPRGMNSGVEQVRKMVSEVVKKRKKPICLTSNPVPLSHNPQFELDFEFRASLVL